MVIPWFQRPDTRQRTDRHPLVYAKTLTRYFLKILRDVRKSGRIIERMVSHVQWNIERILNGDEPWIDGPKNPKNAAPWVREASRRREEREQRRRDRKRVAAYCTWCGKRNDGPDWKVRRCGVCRRYPARKPAGFKYCMNCGARFEKPELRTHAEIMGWNTKACCPSCSGG